MGQTTEYVNSGVEGPHQTDIYTTSTIESLQEIMLRDPSAWDTAYRTNTVAPVLVAGAFLLLLDAANTRRGWLQGKRTVQQRAENAQDYDASDNRTSQIITISSISAFNRQVTVGFAYTATKAGAVQLGKTMAHFLAPWGIRSNVICPGRFPVSMIFNH
jgi:NAD(P)-dependent dehydrogenase (short-subunit alcohol dehydrogenase family)